MGKLFQTIKDHKYGAIIIVLFSVIIIFSVFLSSPKKITPVPTTVNFDSITPGKSTPDDVKKILGDPLKQTQINGFNLFDYKSTSPTRNNQVYYTNGTAQLVKEIVSYKDPKTISDVTKKYGNATNILYGSDSSSGFYLFVDPQNGIAYLGNPNSGTLLEVWYFTPTTLETFITTWATSYSKTPPAPVQ